MLFIVLAFFTLHFALCIYGLFLKIIIVFPKVGSNTKYFNKKKERKKERKKKKRRCTYIKFNLNLMMLPNLRTNLTDTKAVEL